ncbi:MAG TPA: FeoA family protein [Atribacterota bacterium]|nr:FeoA family protein [Atribacterota bacterium]HOR41571.1 FeoA family protein [Atribacterota bacterium]
MIVSLADVKPGKKVKVARIRGGLGVRQRLSCIGIHPGDSLIVLASGIMRGPILVSIHGNKVALGRGIASQVLVEEES